MARTQQAKPRPVDRAADRHAQPGCLGVIVALDHYPPDPDQDDPDARTTSDQPGHRR